MLPINSVRHDTLVIHICLYDFPSVQRGKVMIFSRLFSRIEGWLPEGEKRLLIGVLGKEINHLANLFCRYTES